MYEVEIKSLLGEKQNADSFREQLMNNGAVLVRDAYTQLNHYFTADKGSLVNLTEKLSSYLSENRLLELRDLVEQGIEYSIRTRSMNDKVLFVLKMSIDDTTSDNGIARREFEQSVELSLDDLDALLVESGCKYQAKWSRTREEYTFDGMNVSLDKNAGYGYLTEFEMVVDDQNLVDTARDKIYDALNQFNLVELNQDRLGRMFDYYNNNWSDYYGTEKTFTLE